MWLKTGYFHADRAEAGENAWPTRTLSHSCIVRLSAICRVLGLDVSIRLASESSGGFFRFNSLGAVSLADITPATLTLTRNLAGRQRREHLLDERRDLLDELSIHAARRNLHPVAVAVHDLSVEGSAVPPAARDSGHKVHVELHLRGV